jgi:hypothetical protein
MHRGQGGADDRSRAPASHPVCSGGNCPSRAGGDPVRDKVPDERMDRRDTALLRLTVLVDTRPDRPSVNPGQAFLDRSETFAKRCRTPFPTPRAHSVHKHPSCPCSPDDLPRQAL